MFIYLILDGMISVCLLAICSKGEMISPFLLGICIHTLNFEWNDLTMIICSQYKELWMK